MDEVTRQDGSPNAEGARSLEGEQADEVAVVLPRIGDLVGGKYRIEKVVGRGGMGIVYAAHHLLLDKRVALKLLHRRWAPGRRDGRALLAGSAGIRAAP
jgi:hypothetical protein